IGGMPAAARSGVASAEPPLPNAPLARPTKAPTTIAISSWCNSTLPGNRVPTHRSSPNDLSIASDLPIDQPEAAGRFVELRAIEYSAAVVDHGGFTRAAAALGVAQPSLSEGVQRLERELETTLFERSGRTVRLTVAGDALLGPARQLLRDRDAALDAV